jgi:hypothetical protein
MAGERMSAATGALAGVVPWFSVEARMLHDFDPQGLAPHSVEISMPEFRGKPRKRGVIVWGVARYPFDIKTGRFVGKDPRLACWMMHHEDLARVRAYANGTEKPPALPAAQ